MFLRVSTVHQTEHDMIVIIRPSLLWHWASEREPEAGNVGYYAEGHEEYKGQTSLEFPGLVFLPLSLNTGWCSVVWKARCSKTATLSPMIKKTT